ncbi:MAG: hypothetical protein ABJH72_09740 [Reichenbachiella sp.]|uniref:hypothetical protein n=1 Tax=Reichenbachiella sp. TaxID=2184521 RepID=UPI003265A7AE
MDNRGVVKISYFYSNYFGGRFQTAGVSLFIQPADEFMFIPKVEWIGESFEDAIKQGILDGFKDIDLDIDQGISVQLTDIVNHEIDSSWKSFYMASRIAIRTRKDLRELRAID